jgi:putative phosphoesterase
VDRLRRADLILHAGDFTSTAFFDELWLLGPPLEAVQGNMDEPELREALPRERVVEVERVRIGMVHVAGPTAGREARLRRRFDDCDAVVYGHTHLPQVEWFEGMWILNPGSPTERRRGPSHTMLELEVDAGTISPELVRLT